MQQEQYIHIDECGNKSHYKDRAMTILHRLDGPAYECVDRYSEWWIDDKLHRLDGPAIEWPDGDREWWVDGKRHRLDGPAIEYADGDKAWCVDGKQLTEDQFNNLAAPTLELTLEDIAVKFGVEVSKLKIVK
jgi:hypothetical protein